LSSYHLKQRLYGRTNSGPNNLLGTRTCGL